MVELRCPGWTSGPVVSTTGFWQRFRGIKSVPPHAGVLIRSRSVHTYGLREPLGVVALSAQRKVLAVERVEPRRVVAVAGASEYLELRPDRPLPPVGMQLEARPIVTG